MKTVGTVSEIQIILYLHICICTRIARLKLPIRYYEMNDENDEL